MLSLTKKKNSFPGSAVSGTTRILDAAVAAGVKQFIITASIVSLVALTDFWKEITISEKCEFLSTQSTKKKTREADEELTYTTALPPSLHIAYNPQTAEDALQPDAPVSSSTQSQRVSQIAPYAISSAPTRDLDVTTIHPSYVFGPLGSGQVYNSPATGSNQVHLRSHRWRSQIVPSASTIPRSALLRCTSTCVTWRVHTS
jgi:nucleoside-diphosphate-sugar epimerase